MAVLGYVCMILSFSSLIGCLVFAVKESMKK